MALTPAHVADILATGTIVDEVEMKVDEKLKSGLLHRNAEDGFDVIVPGHLEQEQKLSLVQRFTKAGWKTVRVMNSADNGERPGLVMVTLIS
jgi:hypothetical protein